MSTSDTFTKQQWQDQEALHRFQLISPLLPTGLDDAKRLQLRRAIADENNISVRHNNAPSPLPLRSSLNRCPPDT